MNSEIDMKMNIADLLSDLTSTLEKVKKLEAQLIRSQVSDTDFYKPGADVELPPKKKMKF